MVEKLPLSGIWRFCPDYDNLGLDQQWFVQENQPYLDEKTRTIIPSCWNRISGPFRDFSGIAWYWRVIRVPKYLQGQPLDLYFEGIVHNITIFVDGEKIGDFNGGLLPFNIDFSKWADAKPHFISLRIDGSKEANKYEFESELKYLGIPKDIWIQPRSKIGIDQITLQQEVKDNYAGLTFNIYLRNKTSKDFEGELTIKISKDYVKFAKEVRTVKILKENTRLTSILLQLDEPEFWTVDEPNLYNLEITLQNNNTKEMIVEIRDIIGIREIEINHGDLVLNHEKIELIGYDYEIAEPHFGYALPKTLIADKLYKLKENGINIIRADHGLLDPFVIEMASRIGILVLANIPIKSLSSSEIENQYGVYVKNIIFYPALAGYTLSRDAYNAGGKQLNAIQNIQEVFQKSLDPSRLFETKEINYSKWLYNSEDGLKEREQ